MDTIKVARSLQLRMLRQAPGEDVPAWDDWQEGDEDVFHMPRQTAAAAAQQLNGTNTE